MTVEEVKKIIDEESLKGGNLFGKRENKENEMVIMNVAEQWLVYATDERASKITGSSDCRSKRLYRKTKTNL